MIEDDYAGQAYVLHLYMCPDCMKKKTAKGIHVYKYIHIFTICDTKKYPVFRTGNI